MFGICFKKRPPAVAQQIGIETGMDAEGNKIILRFGNAQHIGRRKRQEDAFGYSNISGDDVLQKGVMAVIADGMGGLSNGDSVSSNTVSWMLDGFQKFGYRDFPENLENLTCQVNDRISEKTWINGKASAGTTLVAAVFQRETLYWVAVGDSRLYLSRNSGLYLLNEDHDYQNKLLGQYIDGDIPMERASQDPQKDALASFIGGGRLNGIDRNRIGFKMKKGDRIFLCTDGVYNGLQNAELIGYLKEDPQTAAEKIIKTVLNKKIKGQDNMTAMVIEYDLKNKS